MTTKESKKEIPTEEEVLKIIAAAQPGNEKDTELCCIHLLRRIDEIMRLRWREDVNFEKKIITLWTRKRKDGSFESNPMHMTDDLYDVLWSRWEKRKQDKWVFFNQNGGNVNGKKVGDRYYHRPKMMDAICKRAGIKLIGVRRITLTPDEIKTFEEMHQCKITEEK